MKCCWSIHPKQSNMMSAGVILLAVMCLPKILSEGSGELKARMAVIFLLLFSGPAFWAYVSARKYQISTTGMIVRYPLGYSRKYCWSDFSEIALCKVHYSAHGTKPTLAIRCVVGKEEFGPAQAIASNEWWSTPGYEVLHFSRVVSIYFTPERYAEFLEHCPYPMKDYRYLKDHL